MVAAENKLGQRDEQEEGNLTLKMLKIFLQPKWQRQKMVQTELVILTFKKRNATFEHIIEKKNDCHFCLQVPAISLSVTVNIKHQKPLT